MYSRRKFISSGITLTAAGLMSTYSRAFTPNKNLPEGKIGIQLFTIPKLLEQDFSGTMKLLAEHGFRQLEFFGPYPFSAEEAKERWKAITPSLGFSGSGYFGQPIKKVKEILLRYNLATPSMHTDMVTLRTRMNQLADAAHFLGQQYVIIPSAPTQSTLDAYKKNADEFNEIGEKARKLGLRFAYHNHGNGLTELDGKIPFNLILENTDPELVFFEMDIYWMTAGRADPVEYLKKYPGRFRLIHIKDMSKLVHFPGDGGDPQQWISLFPYMTNPGSGVLGLKAILNQATQSGMEYFLVEYDMTANPDETLKKSMAFLKTVN